MSSSILEQTLVSIMDQSQDSTAGHAKLITRCQTLYKESEFNEFFENFTAIIRNLLIVSQKNPHVDRAIDFIAKFASDPTNEKMNQTTMDATVVEARQTRNMSNATNNETTNTTVRPNDTTMMENQTVATTMNSMDSEDHENVFLTSLIDFLIETSKANSDAVRYRSCHVLSKLMGAISNDQFIDEDLYDRLSDALLERLKDINSKVQIQAIAAVFRLQDPNDRDCRISKVFLFLMTYDPIWLVRYQALSYVAFSKMTLPDIIERVRDPNANVRKKALLILSEKVLIKFITVAKRLFILTYSLNDEDPGVLSTCIKRLLPSWLAFKENNVVKLLKALDVVESTETMELMMDKLYEDHSIDTICNDFVGVLNEKHVISIENLNAENVFYWSWVCSQCKVKSSEKDKETNEQESRIESEDWLDRILPSLTEFCEYLRVVMQHIEAQMVDESKIEVRLQLEYLFIIKLLIKMFEYLDFSDVHGKKMLTTLCHELFANKHYVFLFDTIMSVYKLLFPNLQQRINNITELISDIKDPHLKIAADKEENEQINNDEIVEHEMTCIGEGTEADSINTTQGLSRLNPRELQLKISEAKYKRFQLKDSFDNLYKEVKQVDKMVDLNKLSELRTLIKECEDEIALLEAYLRGDAQKDRNKKNSINNNNNNTTGTLIEPEVDEETMQTGIEVDPIEVTYHCLSIAICLLKDKSMVQITPQLRSLFDNLIIPNFSSVDMEIRLTSVKAMSLLLILKLEIAQKYLPLLLEMIKNDHKPVVIEAFHALINCIMAFSMNRLANYDAPDHSSSAINSSSTQTNMAPQQIAESTANILAVMTQLLDSEDPEIYTTAAEGFCKLYMTGHIVSAKLLTKLIIMYYSPITENDVKLRSILSTFLPQFAFFRPCNQVCVEETFMLIMRSIINASNDSPLSEIDLSKVMEVMFNLTNPKNLMQRMQHQRVIQHNNICHENIVRSICYEILKDDNTFKNKTYLKIMQMADLTSADYLALKSIHELTDEVQMHISDRLIKKNAIKFNEMVHTLMTKKPEYEEEKKRNEEASRMEQEKSKNDTTCISYKELVEGNQTETSQMNSTRLSSAVEKLSVSCDMIDLDFKKLGKKAGSQKNRDLSNTKMDERSLAIDKNETVVSSDKTVTLDTTSTTTRVTRRSSNRSSSRLDSSQSSSRGVSHEPVLTETSLANTSKTSSKKELTKKRSKSLDSNGEVSESSPEKNKKKRKKRSITENSSSQNTDCDDEQENTRSSRSHTRRNTNEYEPPVKVPKETKRSSSKLKPVTENVRTTRSNSRTSTLQKADKLVSRVEITKRSTRSSSSK